jgi:ferredoxin
MRFRVVIEEARGAGVHVRDCSAADSAKIPAGGRISMGMYIIAEPCIGTKDTACVDVCPVDCIHPRKDEGGFEAAEMLYIDPDTCIQCGNCEPACPVTAIFTEETIPEKWKHYLQVNADWYKKG